MKNKLVIGVLIIAAVMTLINHLILDKLGLFKDVSVLAEVGYYILLLILNASWFFLFINVSKKLHANATIQPEGRGQEKEAV